MQQKTTLAWQWAFQYWLKWWKRNQQTSTQLLLVLQQQCALHCCRSLSDTMVKHDDSPALPLYRETIPWISFDSPLTFYDYGHPKIQQQWLEMRAAASYISSPLLGCVCLIQREASATHLERYLPLSSLTPFCSCAVLGRAAASSIFKDFCMYGEGLNPDLLAWLVLGCAKTFTQVVLGHQNVPLCHSMGFAVREDADDRWVWCVR